MEARTDVTVLTARRLPERVLFRRGQSWCEYRRWTARENASDADAGTMRWAGCDVRDGQIAEPRRQAWTGGEFAPSRVENAGGARGRRRSEPSARSKVASSSWIDGRESSGFCGGRFSAQQRRRHGDAGTWTGRSSLPARSLGARHPRSLGADANPSSAARPRLVESGSTPAPDRRG